MKKFSKAKVNYRKHERQELARQKRRQEKVDTVKDTFNLECEKCGHIYCDHEYKY